MARSLAIARYLPEHEFHFVGGGRVPFAVGGRYPLLEIPFAGMVQNGERLNLAASTVNTLRGVSSGREVRRSILDLIERWQPDLAISDREFHVPIAAKKAGLRCLSIDHQRLLAACRYQVPASQLLPWGLSRLEDELFFDFTVQNLIVSFYHPPLRESDADELFPPVLRPEVTRQRPSHGDHVLVYQSLPSAAVIDAARSLSRPVVVYGAANAGRREGNIGYKLFDERAILEDLASCAYAVVNGGHNLICEALYYGKPVFCVPIANNFEQYLNAWHLCELGYGDFASNVRPTDGLLRAFEKRLDHYRANIRERFVDGTAQVVRRVREIVATRAVIP